MDTPSGNSCRYYIYEKSRGMKSGIAYRDVNNTTKNNTTKNNTTKNNRPRTLVFSVILCLLVVIVGTLVTMALVCPGMIGLEGLTALTPVTDLRLPMKEGFQKWCKLDLPSHVGWAADQPASCWSNLTFVVPFGLFRKVQVTGTPKGNPPWCGESIVAPAAVCYGEVMDVSVRSNKFAVSVSWYGPTWSLYIGWSPCWIPHSDRTSNDPPPCSSFINASPVSTTCSGDS